MGEKDSQDTYNESMHLPLKHKTDVFIKYSSGDVFVTIKIFEQKKVNSSVITRNL